MKSNLKNIGLLFLAAVTFASCSTKDEPITPASAAQFTAVKDAALAAKTQKFSASAGAGTITLTSDKGVIIKLNGNSLTKNGLPVTGAIDIQFIELFDKGSMLVTNKPTMGIMPNGDRNLLISGGEFFIKATQGGVALGTAGNINLNIPAALTNGADQDMTLWGGIIDDKGNLAWGAGVAVDPDGSGIVKKGTLEIGQNSYNVSIPGFGWTNVDKFYSDPRPKTTILVGAPSGYDNTNSSIYLSYDGEGQNALAKLDTYTNAGLFSEHYGQIPVGLACHIIFATEDNGQWRYAVKAVTIQANDVFQFSIGETMVGTEAQLVAAINAIQ